MSGIIETVVKFLNEVWVELQKITWLNRDDFLGSTIVVCILIAFFSIILGLMDAGIASLIKLVL
jgi:preprotein translocase SecE subunit